MIYPPIQQRPIILSLLAAHTYYESVKPFLPNQEAKEKPLTVQQQLNDVLDLEDVLRKHIIARLRTRRGKPALLASRGLSRKRSLALRKFSPSIEALERFIHREPLRCLQECIFGILALESESVDPRL